MQKGLAEREAFFANRVVRGSVVFSVFGRSGDDRLSRVLGHSTMGAGEFNGRVRDGIGFGLRAGITGPAKDRASMALLEEQSGSFSSWPCGHGS